MIIPSVDVSAATTAEVTDVDEVVVGFTEPPVMALYASWNGSMFDGCATLSSFLAGIFLVKLGSDFFFGAEKKELSDFVVFTVDVSPFDTASFFTATVVALGPATVDAFLAGGIFGAGASVAFRFFTGSDEDPASTAHNKGIE